MDAEQGAPEPWLHVEELMCFRRFLSLRALIGIAAEDLERAVLSIPKNDAIPVVLSAAGEGQTLLTAEALLRDYSEAHHACLRVDLRGGRQLEFADVNTRALAGDPWRQLTSRFYDHLRRHRATASYLEIGSHTWDDTQQVARRDFIPATASYTGLDIVPGQNVDVVGDIHQLSRYFRPGQFDVIYSDWVFEHVLMPWAAVLEMNRVLSPGGEVFINTNHSIGLHDMPWDFWRYSGTVWTALFNEYTGFEIVDAALGEPVRITPLRYHEGFVQHHESAGFQASAVWARKTGESLVRWDVDAAALLERLGRLYPKRDAGTPGPA
jgi:SAM-dependent methyltransferase